MSLRINNNVEAFNTHRQLVGSAAKMAKSMERLSSGYRINRAADDAAGLAISEKMRGQITGLAQAQRNAQDGVSLVQTGEGALTEVHSMLQRVRELRTQYGNDTLSATTRTRSAPRSPSSRRRSATSRTNTKFNGVSLLRRRRAGSITLQVGANDGETIAITTSNLSVGVGAGLRGRRHHVGHQRRDVRRARRWRHRHRDRGGLRRPCDVRLGPEPPRAPHRQPRQLPGEPDRRREPHPRRGHGRGDGRVHEVADPAAGRHEHARAGQPGTAVGPVAAPLDIGSRTNRASCNGRPSGRPFRVCKRRIDAC